MIRAPAVKQQIPLWLIYSKRKHPVAHSHATIVHDTVVFLDTPACGMNSTLAVTPVLDANIGPVSSGETLGNTRRQSQTNEMSKLRVHYSGKLVVIVVLGINAYRYSGSFDTSGLVFREGFTQDNARRSHRPATSHPYVVRT